LGKKEEGSGRNRGFWEGRTLRCLFFFILEPPLIWRNSKIVLEEVLDGFGGLS